MNVTLSTEIRKQVERELATGRYQRVNDLIEQAVLHFLDHRRRAQRRINALRKGAAAFDPADLYEQVLNPDPD